MLTPLVIPLHARKSHISYESVFIFTSVTMSSLQPLREGVGVQMVPNWLDKSAQIIFVSDNVKKRGLNDLIWGIRAQFWGRFFFWEVFPYG